MAKVNQSAGKAVVSSSTEAASVDPARIAVLASGARDQMGSLAPETLDWHCRVSQGLVSRIGLLCAAAQSYFEAHAGGSVDRKEVDAFFEIITEQHLLLIDHLSCLNELRSGKALAPVGGLQ
ncbi:hypothetical protein [Methylibium petroleiphilum]|uniref:hypothetical protein n=1 Tax=Methylibium petroleiphilum TaxID=105560 RepID=UPI001AC6D302|nr:hypothetical protein [Methylibium petroleiphilum]MBN9203029.1 hypothetical protein [Methylibium petroleiphilum]